MHKRRKCFGMYAPGFMQAVTGAPGAPSAPGAPGAPPPVTTSGPPLPHAPVPGHTNMVPPSPATLSMMSASASFNDLSKFNQFVETPNAPSSGTCPDARTMAIAGILAKCPVGAPRVVYDKEGNPKGIFLPMDTGAGAARG